MRVPPSKPSDLFRDGAGIRIWRDTHAKLKQLAGIRGIGLAVLLDEVVHAALQAEYDRMEAEDEALQP